MYRFLLRPRWVVLHVIMLVAMPLFTVAGFWQLRRLEERRASNALVAQRGELPAVTSLRGTDLTFRHAHLVGRYDPSEEVILTGRPSRGRSGDHVLMPLRVGNRSVIVDRGWVPARSNEYTTPKEVTLEGILLPSEGRAPFTDGEGPTDRITRIDLDRLKSDVPVYLLLKTQLPAQANGLPYPADLAQLAEGSHFAYAVQWFLFIPTAIIVYVLVLRREAKKVPD
jgi:cytochrome oxidase assembly protein ShyY1